MTRPPTSVIALGGSAGSIEPLLAVVRALPADLPGAVLVVVHLSPTVPSYLAGIVARSTALDVAHLGPSGPLRAGTIYVAPPDHHLEVDAQGYALRRGPREAGVATEDAPWWPPHKIAGRELAPYLTAHPELLIESTPS